MGKGSYIKITVTLIITLCYVFLFGSTEKIESINNLRLIDSESAEYAEETDDVSDSTASETASDTASDTYSQADDSVTFTFPEYKDLDIAAQVKPFELNGAVTIPAGFAAVPEEAVNVTEAARPQKRISKLQRPPPPLQLPFPKKQPLPNGKPRRLPPKQLRPKPQPPKHKPRKAHRKLRRKILRILRQGLTLSLILPPMLTRASLP